MGCCNSTATKTTGAAKKAPKVVVLFYSTYGHCYAMAKAAAEGAAGAGAVVDVRRIAETLPTEVLAKMHAVDAQKAFAAVKLANASELASYDAILIVTPTRFGSLPTQVRAFLDATGQLWLSGALVSKVGGGIVSSATQHGGQETTFRALRNFFLHQGMIVTGLSFPGMMGLDEIKGGSPYGATTITGGQGERLPSAVELEGARVQGAQIAGYAAKLIV
jgi:NAD(P)H dehydrogenase (quinone)